jgi:hypothetical protein
MDTVDGLTSGRTSRRSCGVEDDVLTCVQESIFERMESEYDSFKRIHERHECSYLFALAQYAHSSDALAGAGRC